MGEATNLNWCRNSEPLTVFEKVNDGLLTFLFQKEFWVQIFLGDMISWGTKKRRSFSFLKLHFQGWLGRKTAVIKVLIPEATSPRCKCNQLTLHGAGAARFETRYEMPWRLVFRVFTKGGEGFSSRKKRVLIYQESWVFFWGVELSTSWEK